MVPPLKNEDLITKIWLLSKNKSVRAADDRPYTDTETIYRAVVGDGVPDIPRKMRREKTATFNMKYTIKS